MVISWRVGEAARLEQGDSAVGSGRGGYTVGTDAARADAVTSSSEAAPVDQVTVLNGATARVTWRRLHPWGWAGAVVTPKGAQAVVGADWIETGDVVLVRALWRGGRAPVEVSLSVDRRDFDGTAPSRQTWQSVLRVPLGTWVTVASGGASRVTPSPGVTETRTLDAGRRQLLQLKVERAAPVRDARSP